MLAKVLRQAMRLTSSARSLAEPSNRSALPLQTAPRPSNLLRSDGPYDYWSVRGEHHACPLARQRRVGDLRLGVSTSETPSFDQPQSFATICRTTWSMPLRLSRVHPQQPLETLCHWRGYSQHGPGS